MKMKDYLNNKQMNDMLFTFHLLEQNTRMVDEWQKHNSLTTTEAGNLRRAITYTNKFLEDVLVRLGPKEIEKVRKRTVKAMDEPVRILDKWMERRIFGTYDSQYQIVKIERPSFEKLGMACIQAHCEDCKNSFNDCDIYDIFEDNLMPRAELNKNCPYSFDSEETTRKKKEKERVKLEAKSKLSKRARKKANRFDEDDEIIEYNFTPKGDK